MREKAVPGIHSIHLTRADSARVGSSGRPWRRRADRGPEASKLSEIGRLGSGVGEGNRTPDLQNHNLAL